MMRKRKISGAGVVMLFGLLAPIAFASAREAKSAQKGAALLVEVDGKLLSFQEEQMECTYKPGASIHGLFESPPQARFVIVGPNVHSGRTFDVVFKCNIRNDILATLESGRDRVFRLALPGVFLDDADPRIEDCAIGKKGMSRWRLQEKVRKASLPANAAEQGLALPGTLAKASGEAKLADEKPPEQAVIVHFGYGSTDLGRLFAFQSKLERVVAGARVGEVDGNEVATDGSDGFLYMYGPDADRLFKAVSPILESCEFMKGATVKLRYGPPGAGVRERSVVVGAYQPVAD